MALIIFHYPKCKKSRAALEYISKLGIKPEVINYTENGLRADEISNIAKLLGVTPFELIRTQEEYFKENLKDSVFSDNDWIRILTQHPKLLKRPIVVYEGKSVIADPATLVDKIL